MKKQQYYECLFSKRRCRAMDDQKIKMIYERDISEFIYKVCGMCIKKQYANAKERMSKKKYVVVNTL